MKTCVQFPTAEAQIAVWLFDIFQLESQEKRRQPGLHRMLQNRGENSNSLIASHCKTRGQLKDMS